jgi:uncharacterized protein YidB (DUF937 family)
MNPERMMGIFDKAFDTLGNNQPQHMGSGTRLLQAAMSLLVNNGQNGGLPGLMDRFQEAGLGNAVSSWIGTGENVPVTPAQVQQALGDGPLQQISEEAALSQDETANHLSELLPTLVDKLTPAGHIPPGGLGEMSELLEQFFRK